MEKVKTDEGKMANFYMDLVDLEEKLLSIEWNVHLSDEIKSQWLEGKPILSQVQLSIEPKQFLEVMLDVVRACLKWQPGPQLLSEEIISLLNNLSEQELTELADIIIKDNVARQKPWAEKLKISEEMFEFLAHNVARLYLRSYAKNAARQLAIDKWLKGYCPVCGESPVMAKLTGKYGKRVLYCGRCESEWGYLRLGCPFCGNQDTDKLSFITPEDYKQYRLYLCEKCKSYLKTVDERKCGEVDLFCEDLATSDFDKLAAAEGYQRGDKRERA